MKKTFQKFFEKIGKYNQVVDQYRRATGTSPDHAMAYVNWGIELAQDEHIDEALAKFEKAAEMAPSRAEPWTNWGVALAKCGQLDEAIGKFKRALEIDPKSANNYMLWGAALIEQGKMEEAIVKYNHAMELAPDNPEPYVNLGVAMARIGRYPDAIRHFKESLAKHSQQPHVYFLWGAVLAELGQYEEAIDKFKATLRFIPSHADSHYFWSVALNRLGKYEQALEKSRKALEYQTEKPEYYLNQGDILANLERYDVALANYRHAVTLSPDMSEAYVSWGVALFKLGQYDEAMARFEKALSLAPEIPGIEKHIGNLLLEQHRYTEALPHLEQAHAEEPDNVEVLLNWSMALIKCGQSNVALDKLKTIERRDKWNPQVHYLLGTHYMGLGELEQAASHLEKALAEAADFEDAAINLSLVRCELGETAEAIRTMRPILRKYPDSPKINFFYGTILYRNGDQADAIEKYQKAASLDPDYAEPKIGLAEIYIKQDRADQARSMLDTVLGQTPGHPAALFLTGFLLTREAEKTGETALWQQALDRFDQVLAADPAHLDAAINRAYVLGRLQSPDTANELMSDLSDDARPMNAETRAIVLYRWGEILEKLDADRFARQAGEKKQAARQLHPAIDERIRVIDL